VVVKAISCFNTTPGTVWVKLNEIACRNDDITLQPGEIKGISAAGSMTSSIEAQGLA